MNQFRSIKTMRDNTGFTLIELMVVIAVIATLTAISVPNFLAYLPNARLKSAARELYSNMQLAKMGAIKQNTDWAIVFDKTDDKYQVCSGKGEDGLWSGTDNAVEKTVVLSDYGSGVAYGHGDATSAIDSNFDDEITYASTPNVFIVNSQGTSNAGYVYLQNISNKTFGVGTLSSGVIMLRKWTGSAWEE